MHFGWACRTPCVATSKPAGLEVGRVAFINYFAFGSNLCAARLQHRVPSAKFRATAWLQGHVLCFAPGQALDGSGKCNVFQTGVSNDVVHGAVFELAGRDKPTLDAIEGAGFGYEPTRVLVQTTDGDMSAYMYITAQDSKHDFLAPYDWYLNLVVSGATELGLPEVYIDQLRGTPARRDPQADRAQRERDFVTPGQPS